MGRFGHENGPFWMLAGAVLVLFFLPLGRFGFSGPFSTYIGAVLAMGRFGRFSRKVSSCAPIVEFLCTPGLMANLCKNSKF